MSKRLVAEQALDRRQTIYWLSLFIMMFALVIMMFALAWSAGPLMLRSLARLWIVSDGLDHADAIVVLGGGLDVRPAAAAELYKLGKANRVAIGFSEYDQGRDARLTRTKLLQHGVPATAIVAPFQPVIVGQAFKKAIAQICIETAVVPIWRDGCLTIVRCLPVGVPGASKTDRGNSTERRQDQSNQTKFSHALVPRTSAYETAGNPPEMTKRGAIQVVA
jgi:hypothetical protein